MGWKNATAGLVQKVNFDDAFELILMYCDKNRFYEINNIFLLNLSSSFDHLL